MRKIILFALILSVFPTIAFAVEIVYTWGYGEMMRDTLMAVSSVFNSSDYKTLVKIIVIFGFIVLGFQIFFTFRAEKFVLFIKYFLVIALVGTVIFGQKTSVVVHDEIDPYVASVPNVPFGVAKVMSLFSRMEYHLTRTFDLYYSPAWGDLRYSESGLGFSVTSIANTSDVSIHDSYILRTMDEYTQNCLFYDFLDGSKNLNAFARTNDFWGPDGLQSFSSRLTAYYTSANPSGSVDSCGNVFIQLFNRVHSYTNNFTMPQIASALGFSSTAQLDSMFGTVNSKILNISVSGQESILNSTGMNMFNNSVINTAKMVGVDPQALAYGTALAQSQQRHQMATATSMAKRYLPIIKGILTVIFIAAIPLIILLAFTPFAFAYLKMILMLFIWLMIWNPLFCVLNVVINSKAKETLEKVATINGGYSLQTKPIIDNYAHDTIAWIGNFAWLVPMIALMIAKASEYAFTSFAGDIKSSAMSASSAAASQTSTGSVSFGNTSHSNFTANKMLAKNTYDIGRSVSVGYSSPHGTASYEGGALINSTVGQGTSGFIGAPGSVPFDETETQVGNTKTFSLNPRGRRLVVGMFGTGKDGEPVALSIPTGEGSAGTVTKSIVSSRRDDLTSAITEGDSVASEVMAYLSDSLSKGNSRAINASSSKELDLANKFSQAFTQSADAAGVATFNSIQSNQANEALRNSISNSAGVDLSKLSKGFIAVKHGRAYLTENGKTHALNLTSSDAESISKIYNSSLKGSMENNFGNSLKFMRTYGELVNRSTEQGATLSDKMAKNINRQNSAVHNLSVAESLGQQHSHSTALSFMNYLASEQAFKDGVVDQNYSESYKNAQNNAEKRKVLRDLFASFLMGPSNPERSDHAAASFMKSPQGRYVSDLVEKDQSAINDQSANFINKLGVELEGTSTSIVGQQEELGFSPDGNLPESSTLFLVPRLRDEMNRTPLPPDIPDPTRTVNSFATDVAGRIEDTERNKIALSDLNKLDSGLDSTYADNMKEADFKRHVALGITSGNRAMDGDIFHYKMADMHGNKVEGIQTTIKDGRIYARTYQNKNYAWVPVRLGNSYKGESGRPIRFMEYSVGDYRFVRPAAVLSSGRLAPMYTDAGSPALFIDKDQPGGARTGDPNPSTSNHTKLNPNIIATGTDINNLTETGYSVCKKGVCTPILESTPFYPDRNSSLGSMFIPNNDRTGYTHLKETAVGSNSYRPVKQTTGVNKSNDVTLPRVTNCNPDDAALVAEKPRQGK